MAEGLTVLYQHSQPVKVKCQHAQDLVFDPELTQVTLKPSVRREP